MQPTLQKPKNRSELRLYAGQKYYTFLRHIKWKLGRYKFATIQPDELAHPVFSHATPLFRRLKDVDMYLQENKVINLRLAIKQLHGTTLYPGETLSFWKQIGKPTARKGYVPGMLLKNGTVQSGVGGGLCQLSNLIYWMTIHTPLQVAERHRHAYDVFPDVNRTQPFGSGATCFYNYGDLVIHNPTAQAFQLFLKIKDDALQGEWRSQKPFDFFYEVYEKEHRMQQEYWGGYTRHNVLFRRKWDGYGNLLADEYVVENHAVMMYPPFLGEGNPE